MAKIRPDFESSLYARFLKWVRDGSDRLDEDMAGMQADRSMDPSPAPPEQDMERVMAERKVYDRAQEWGSHQGFRLRNRTYSFLSLFLCLSIIAVLLYATSQLPAFGRAGNPAHNEVSERYLEKGMEETGAVNLVSGMILDYRAFDTLGESNVLLTAVLSVIMLLHMQRREGDPRQEMEDLADQTLYEPRHDPILQTVTRVLMPMLLLFGIYVVLNGHLSPGGGFSGGAVLGAALILHTNAFGSSSTRRFMNMRIFQAVTGTALCFYGLAKAYSFFVGANHLPSIFTPGTPGRLFSAGLIPYLNIAVGLVVACTISALYTLFRKGDL